MKKKLLLLFGVSLLLSACYDKDQHQATYSVDPQNPIMMVVCNEGLWSKGNAAISTVFRDGTVEPDIFQRVNNRPLGDQAQSIFYDQGKYYICVTNSSKIEVVDATSFVSLKTIELNAKPRRIVKINDHQLAVSDQQKMLTIIDLNDTEHPKYYSTPCYMEYMLVVGNKLFGGYGDALYVYDLTDISAGPREILYSEEYQYQTYETGELLIDKKGMLWVMATDNSFETPGVCFFGIDPTTEKIVKKGYSRFYYPKNGELFTEGAMRPMTPFPRVDFDPTGNKFYFTAMILDSDKKDISVIYSYDPVADRFALKTRLTGVKLIYGMNVAPNGDIYVCDVLDYTGQRGYIRRFSETGEKIDYKVGVYPNYIHFTDNEK